jgi:hypothetical protein
MGRKVSGIGVYDFARDCGDHDDVITLRAA